MSEVPSENFSVGSYTDFASGLEVQSLGPYLTFMILDIGGLIPELQEEILMGTSVTSLKGPWPNP